MRERDTLVQEVLCVINTELHWYQDPLYLKGSFQMFKEMFTYMSTLTVTLFCFI